MSKIKISKIAHFSGHKDAIFALGYGLTPALFYSGGADGYIVEWDLITRGDGKLLVRVPNPVYTFCLHREAQLLFCGTASGNLHVIDLKQRKEIRNIEAHTLGIFDIKINGDLLITAGGDGKVKVWNLPMLSLVKELSFSEKSARVLSIHPTKPQIAVGYSDFHIRIFSTVDFTLTQTIPAHNNSIFALTYTPDGNTLISGGRDVMLRSWDGKNNYDLVHDIPAHTLHINAIAFNPSGELFATVSMDKTLKIWQGNTFELLKVADKIKSEGHISSVNKALWLNNTQLLTCSDDRTVILWELENN